MMYTALEEKNFFWEPEELEAFRNLWNKGLDFVEISEELQRDQVEVAVIIMDQELAGKIQARG